MAPYFLFYIHFLIERTGQVMRASFLAAHDQAVILAQEKLGSTGTKPKSQALADCISNFNERVRNGVSNPPGRPRIDKGHCGQIFSQ